MTSKNFMDEYQFDAAEKLSSGNILVGGTGAGKSRTAIAWWYLMCGGKIDICKGPIYDEGIKFKDLYIITTAKKRDDKDFDFELQPFYVWPDDRDGCGVYVHVDSWNNIAKYSNVSGAVFIFDEDHLTGKGKWVKSFYKIAAHNTWIVATATPGDKWMDFYPVFHANGFFKSKREFEENHVIYNPHTPYPSVFGYYGEGRLNLYKRKIVVQMEYEHKTECHDIYIECDYDKVAYDNCERYLFNPYSDDPIESGSGLCYCLRRICNSDSSRIRKVVDIINEFGAWKGRNRYIIFYSFNYELDILRGIDGLLNGNWTVAEYNGQRHDPLPDGDNWIYLVNYGSGSEAWNCITSDVIIFYSQQYSYKTLVQAKGRIDRRNTPFFDLYYYHLRCSSKIDRAIGRALRGKKEFNERDFYAWRFEKRK